MKSIKVILSGIILILAGLFFMGLCILNNGGKYDFISLTLFVVGLIVSGIGLLFIKED